MEPYIRFFPIIFIMFTSVERERENRFVYL